VTPLPSSHRDLLDRPLPAVLSTEMPDGRLQSTVVWSNRDGQQVLLSTMREFQKAANLRARPRATVLVVDPDDDGRWLEVRGRVEMHDEGALEHLDALSVLYTGRAPYFGEVVDAELATAETPVQLRLTPTAVVIETRLARTTERSTRPPPAGWGRRRSCTDDAVIPDSHRPLLTRPLPAAMSTRLPTGAAQTQPVWFQLVGNDLLVSTTRERQKGRNLEADARATLLIVDPDDDGHWISVRADVDLLDDPGEEILDRLARRYTAHDRFYGGVYPAERRVRETRLVARLHPRRVTLDAVH
jgi:PPOX class probable F420-dependent enzyme